jgi:hypothetical protein
LKDARMQLIENWKQIALKAWSSRLAWLSALLSATEVALPFFDGLLPVEKGTFAILALLVSAGAGIARLVAQPETLPATPDKEATHG